jgi:hypothetical protein
MRPLAPVAWWLAGLLKYIFKNRTLLFHAGTPAKAPSGTSVADVRRPAGRNAARGRK